MFALWSHRWFGLCYVLILIGVFAQPSRADLQELMKAKGRKILFLGDSNTFAGLYIAYVEGYLRTRFPAEPWEMINLGLPSETLSGLSEPDHPYPRPDVHERVDRALAKIKPNIVFICYGMNDGIYYPFAQERLAKYKEGTEKLVAKIERTGAKVILMTPAPFDPVPVKKNLLPAGAAKYSWMKPYEKYDDVLRKYSDYLLEWRKKGYTVVDAHAAVHRFLKAIRAKEPTYTVSGDGIHPNPTGHAVIAFEILRELKAPAEIDAAEIDFKQAKVKRGKVTLGQFKKDSMNLTWSGIAWPMPVDSRWDTRLPDVTPFHRQFNRLELEIGGLPPGKYEIVDQSRPDSHLLGTVTNEALAKGIVITEFQNLTVNKMMNEVGKKIQQRQKKSGLAWLTEIGHKRPDTPKGEPLDKILGALTKEEADLREFLQIRFRTALRIQRKD